MIGLLAAEYLVHVLHGLRQPTLIVGGHRNDVVHRDIAQHAGLNLYLLRVGLPLHLVASSELVAAHHVHALEHLHTGGIEITVEDAGARCLGVETAALRLLTPLVAIAVAFEVDGARQSDVVANHLDDGFRLVLALCHESVYTLTEFGQRLCHGGIENNHCGSTVSLRAYGTKLEAITREGERRRAVAVGIVDEQFGNLRNVEFHALLAGNGEEVLGVGGLYLPQQIAKLLAEERRDDGWRSLVGTQSVGVGCTHDGSLQESVVAPYGLQRLYDEHHEAQVLLCRLARCMQQHTRIGGKAPVVVLTRTVDACEGLLVQQHAEAMMAGDALHELHEQHIMVDGEVALLVDGCQLELVRCHLVVTRLHGNAQLEGLYLQVFHECLHALGDGTEVVVVHLLVLRRVVAHQRATRQHEVGTC